MTPSDARTVEYTDLTDPTEEQIQQIIELYRNQGWWQPGDDRTGRLVPKIIAGSHCFVIATAGRRIVGMGRAISDGISDAYIQDLTVRIDRRKEGIGQRILETLLQRLHAGGIRWIGLIAEPGSRELYLRAGFRDMSGSTPMLMTGEP